MIQTRAQQFAALAYGHVSEVHAWSDREARRRYGMLCNRFPLMVLENGLAQAVAFLEAKNGEEREGQGSRSAEKPEGALLRHLAAVLGVAPHLLRRTVITADLTAYRHQTRTLLDATIWYKRFAQSVLKVDPSGHIEDEETVQEAEEDA